MFGGAGTSPNTLNETWVFDGACWQKVIPSISPAPRLGAAVAYDPLLGKTLMIGGRTQMSGLPDYPEDAWSWDGTTWTQISGAPQLDFPVASFDASHQVVVVYGFGSTGPPQTWTWNGTTWQQKAPRQSPSVDSQSAMCFDHSTNKILLYGGVSVSVPGGVSNQTWLWDGENWAEAQPIHNPGPRYSHLLACGSQTILLGGLTNQLGTPGTGTWIWNATDWQEIITSRIPDNCCGAIVYDGNQFVMFETGQDGIPIWKWSGTDWSRVA